MYESKNKYQHCKPSILGKPECQLNLPKWGSLKYNSNLKYKINFASVNLVNVVNLKTNQNIQEFGNLKYNSNVKYKINLAIVNLVNLVNLKYN